MSFDWTKYIELAEFLHNQKTEESYRSAISRAYYGVFCLSRNRKGFKNRKPKKGENIHWIVINEYKNSSNRHEKDVGKYLDELRRCRNDSDYNEDKKIDEQKSERSILKAKIILENFRLIQ